MHIAILPPPRNDQKFLKLLPTLTIPTVYEFILYIYNHIYNITIHVYVYMYICT